MAVEKFEAPYGLVFHFNAYTGNFEREFCAYVIGAVGECNVGHQMASLYEEDHPEGTSFYNLSDRTRSEPDDNGCRRPVSIYHDLEVDKEPYNSLIIFFDTLPDEDAFKMIMERAKDFVIMKRTKDFAKNRSDWRSPSQKQPLTLFGATLISNKITRVIKTEKIFAL